MWACVDLLCWTKYLIYYMVLLRNLSFPSWSRVQTLIIFFIDFIVFINLLIVSDLTRAINNSWRIYHMVNRIFRYQKLVVSILNADIIILLLNRTPWHNYSLSVACDRIVPSLSYSVDNLRIVYFICSWILASLNWRLGLWLWAILNHIFFCNLV